MMIRGLVLLGLHWVQANEDKIECYVDEKGPKDDPNNIFKCIKPQKCCHETGRPTCCTERPLAEAAVEQAKLWGAVVAIIIVLALVMWYTRHDGNCCSNKKRKEGGCCSCPENDSDIDVMGDPEEEKQPESLEDE